MNSPKVANGVIDNFLVYMLAFLGPYSVTFLDKQNLILCFIISSFFLIVSLLLQRGKKISSFSFLIISPILMAVFIGYASAAFNARISGGEYTSQILTGRLFTTMSTILFVLAVSLWSSRATISEIYIFLKIALFSTVVFLFFACVQQVFFTLKIPFFIDSRSDMHGVSQDLRLILPNRLTSLAREPNYYAPILVESLIIARLCLSGLSKIVFNLVTFAVLVLTFSGGAYVHFTLFSVFLIVHKYEFTWFSTKRYILLTILIILFLFVIYFSFNDFVLILRDYIEAKSNTESSGSSDRGQIMRFIFDTWLTSDVHNLLFGYGIGSLTYFSQITGVGIGLDFSITNNLYLDYLWDSGLVGILILIFFWSAAFFSFYKKTFFTKEYEAGLLLFFSFFVTGLFRSEYVTTHYAWVLSILIVLNSFNKFKKHTL